MYIRVQDKLYSNKKGLNPCLHQIGLGRASQLGGGPGTCVSSQGNHGDEPIMFPLKYTLKLLHTPLSFILEPKNGF